jgi:hypothetical protein
MIDGQCHKAWDVNYAYYGHIMHLCYSFYPVWLEVDLDSLNYTPAQRLNAIKAFRTFFFGIEAAKENARSFKAFMAKIKPTEYRKEDAETAARWVAVGFREWAIGGSQAPKSWYENCGRAKRVSPGGSATSTPNGTRMRSELSRASA